MPSGQFLSRISRIRGSGPHCPWRPVRARPRRPPGPQQRAGCFPACALKRRSYGRFGCVLSSTDRNKFQNPAILPRKRTSVRMPGSLGRPSSRRVVFREGRLPGGPSSGRAASRGTGRSTARPRGADGFEGPRVPGRTTEVNVTEIRDLAETWGADPAPRFPPGPRFPPKPAPPRPDRPRRNGHTGTSWSPVGGATRSAPAADSAGAGGATRPAPGAAGAGGATRPAGPGRRSNSATLSEDTRTSY